jgi:hypothetical protein
MDNKLHCYVSFSNYHVIILQSLLDSYLEVIFCGNFALMWCNLSPCALVSVKLNCFAVVTQVEIKKAEPRDSGKMGDGPPSQWGPPQGGPPMGMGGVSLCIDYDIVYVTAISGCVSS